MADGLTQNDEQQLQVVMKLYTYIWHYQRGEVMITTVVCDCLTCRRWSSLVFQLIVKHNAKEPNKFTSYVGHKQECTFKQFLSLLNNQRVKYLKTNSQMVSSAQNENSVIKYSPSCRSKPVIHLRNTN